MSEDFSIYKNVENFLNNNCLYHKNECFASNFSFEEENSDELPILYDQNNSIQCIMNIPREKISLLKEDKNLKEKKVKIIDSSFELVLSKSDNNPSLIKCILLLIINDIEIIEKIKLNEKEINLIDINNDYEILKKLKKFMFNYIKDKKNKNSNNNNIFENILFKNAINGVKFFNYEKNGIYYKNDDIKKIIDNIKLIESKIEIKQKENDKIKETSLKQKKKRK